MRTLNVLICGSDEPAMQRMAKSLSDEGVRVEISGRPGDWFGLNPQGWDFLLVDLDGLNSFLRSLLPAICSNIPNLSIVGVSVKSKDGSDSLSLTNGLRLDACLFKLPRAEDLIACTPRVAAKYLCDTKPLASSNLQFEYQ